eukprot:gene8547-371_t
MFIKKESKEKIEILSRKISQQQSAISLLELELKEAKRIISKLQLSKEEYDDLKFQKQNLSNKLIKVYKENLTRQEEEKKCRVQIKNLLEENDILKKHQKIIDKLKTIVQGKPERDLKTSYEKMKKILILEYQKKEIPREKMFSDLKEMRKFSQQRRDSTLNLENLKDKYEQLETFSSLNKKRIHSRTASVNFK